MTTPLLNRRTLLKLIGMGSATTLGGFVVQRVAQDRPLKLLQTTINGLAYYEGTKGVLKEMQPGERLLLRREPENAHDEKAIEVFASDGRKLGYVPRVDNAVLANLADQGWTLQAVLDGAEPARWPYDCAEITIYGHPA